MTEGAARPFIEMAGTSCLVPDAAIALLQLPF
jgi:hypothetical protein